MIKNLRILIYTNPLIRDDAGKYLYDKDSGFICMKHIIESMPADYRYTWVVPESVYLEENWERWPWFTSANKNVDVIPYPFGSSVLYNRYYFNGTYLHQRISADEDIDVIFCNQPEVAAALKVWAVYRNTHPVIISFFHWMDVKASREFSAEFAGYFWREYEAYLQSDCCMFHNDYARDLFYQEIKDHIKDEPDRPTGLFHPPPTIFGKESFELPPEAVGKKIVLFNHRLNRTTNFKAAIDALDELYKERQDFVMWLTDEKKDVNVGDSVDKPFIIRKTMPANQYGKLIQQSHVAICNHKGYSTWNMAILDSLVNGCFTLIPYDSVYKEMFDDVGFEYGQYHNFDNLKQLVNDCLNTDVEILRKKAEGICKSAPAFQHTDDILTIIENAINKKIPSETYKGYEDVKQYIENRGICSKEEWVDKFWAGNRNSNFLRIRWLLLKNGISDDTSAKNTVYHYDGKVTEQLVDVQPALFLPPKEYYHG